MKKKIHVGLVDLKLNNLYTIVRALEKLNYKVSIANNFKKFNFDMLIVPGTGSFNQAMKNLKEEKLDYKINDFYLSNKLILGICLGMQLLFEKSSEFGNRKGLGLVKGDVRRIPQKSCFNIPHTRWNSAISKNSLLKDLFENKKNNYYFVHSYYCKPKNSKEVACSTVYDDFNFCSVVHKNKLIGTQFHPEKSGLAGVKFFKNLKKFI